ncbi:hypothetical protein T440DRAFT_403859, partial [Plenodomus tracheiphilus IPT5]
IIFTCWTRTLDLIQRYLSRANLNHSNYRRIDGDCPTTKRERILHDFKTDPELHVLIMTTGTGAVGLNLAAANRVFIVEPQWNPSVEDQAIARALRLGQKHAVLVTRNVVDQTVEKVSRNILGLFLCINRIRICGLCKRGSSNEQISSRVGNLAFSRNPQSKLDQCENPSTQVWLHVIEHIHTVQSITSYDAC